MRSLLFALALLLGSPLPATAAALVIVANPGLDGFRPGFPELARVYRREQRITRTGERLIPVNLPAGDPLRRAFSLALFGQPPEAMLEFWDQMYFHGISPPKVVQSQEAMLRFVAITPGAVGYVADCRLPRGVKVLRRLPLARGSKLPECGAQHR